MAGGDRVVACALARSIGKVRRWKLRLIGVAVAALGRALERLQGGDDGDNGGDGGDGGGEVQVAKGWRSRQRATSHGRRARLFRNLAEAISVAESGGTKPKRLKL